MAGGLPVGWCLAAAALPPAFRRRGVSPPPGGLRLTRGAWAQLRWVHAPPPTTSTHTACRCAGRPSASAGLRPARVSHGSVLRRTSSPRTSPPGGGLRPPHPPQRLRRACRLLGGQLADRRAGGRLTRVWNKLEEGAIHPQGEALLKIPNWLKLLAIST